MVPCSVPLNFNWVPNSWEVTSDGGGKPLASRHSVLGSSYVRMSSFSTTTTWHKSVWILPVKCILSKNTIFLSWSDIWVNVCYVFHFPSAVHTAFVVASYQACGRLPRTVVWTYMLQPVCRVCVCNELRWKQARRTSDEPKLTSWNHCFRKHCLLVLVTVICMWACVSLWMWMIIFF